MGRRALPLDEILLGDAVTVLKKLPPASVQLVVTSPPYFDAKDYGCADQIGKRDTDHPAEARYRHFLDRLQAVWRAVARVLAPNGKLCINAPILPCRKGEVEGPSVRTYRNIAADIEAGILQDRRLSRQLFRFSLYIWQKQTSEFMLGSYPYPRNLFEQNTIEFIHVYVKGGPSAPAPDDQSREAGALGAKENAPHLEKLRHIADRLQWPEGSRSDRRLLKAVDNALAAAVSSLSAKAFRRKGRANSQALRRARVDALAATGEAKDLVKAGRLATRIWEVRQAALRSLTSQVWSIYPEDVHRQGPHPAPFPEELPARLIRMYTFPGDVVLDPFCGSGTTCAAAARLGRHGIGIDLSERYCQHARQRLARITSVKPSTTGRRP